MTSEVIVLVGILKKLFCHIKEVDFVLDLIDFFNVL